MKELLILTEPKWFCLLIVAFFLFFKAKILSNATKKQNACYIFSIAGILVSVLSDFLANQIAQTICFAVSSIVFALALFFLLENEKPLVLIPLSVIEGALSFLSLKQGLNVITYAITFIIITVFAIEQYNTIRVDNLTKLYNRYGLDAELREQLRQYKRDNTDSFYIISCDLDKFKSINDTFGHLEGDRALGLVAEALSRVSSRFECEVFRIGGDEFVIITDKSDKGVAEEITKALEEEFDKIDFRDDFNIEMSVGVALYDGVSTIDEILDAADKKLYEAKRR